MVRTSSPERVDWRVEGSTVWVWKEGEKEEEEEEVLGLVVVVLGQVFLCVFQSVFWHSREQ